MITTHKSQTSANTFLKNISICDPVQPKKCSKIRSEIRQTRIWIDSETRSNASDRLTYEQSEAMEVEQ